MLQAPPARASMPSPRLRVCAHCAYTPGGPPHVSSAASRRPEERSGPACAPYRTGRRSTASSIPQRLGRPHNMSHFESGYAHTMRIRQEDPHTCPSGRSRRPAQRSGPACAPNRTPTLDRMPQAPPARAPARMRSPRVRVCAHPAHTPGRPPHATRPAGGDTRSPQPATLAAPRLQPSPARGTRSPRHPQPAARAAAPRPLTRSAAASRPARDGTDERCPRCAGGHTRGTGCRGSGRVGRCRGRRSRRRRASR
jgi:hypothetical protein